MRQQNDNGIAIGGVPERQDVPQPCDTMAPDPGPWNPKPGRLAYASPKVESTVMDGHLPPDVVAEWSGVAIDGPKKATRANSDRKSHTTVDHNDTERPVLARWISALPSCPSRRTNVVEYPLDGEALLYDGALQTVYCLNATAFHVWRHCDGRSIEQLAFALTAAFDVEFDTAIEHVNKVVELLSLGGLFAEEVSDATTP